MRDDGQTYGFSKLNASQLLQVIRSGEYEVGQPVSVGGRGQVQIAYVYPPTGGIPAASYNAISEILDPGYADCFMAVAGAGTFSKGTDTVTVENITSSIVGANGRPLVAAKTSYSSGNWVVLVEDCSSSGGGS